jgi:hypothetical protein
MAQDNNPEEQDNIRTAMDKVAETLTPTVSPLINAVDGPADKQVLIRTNDYERNRWKEAATLEQVTLSAWIRNTLNSEAKRLLECEHPLNMMRFYPWAKICTKCGARLKS